jgi:hypothetical protein
LLNFEILAKIEGIDTDLNDASVVKSLSIVISFLDSFGNVAHDQELFAFFSLVDGVIKDDVQNSLCNVIFIARF